MVIHEHIHLSSRDMKVVVIQVDFHPNDYSDDINECI